MVTVEVEGSQPRQHLFVALLRRSGWTRQQLWLDYVGLGGAHDLFDLDAYLADLLSWTDGEQDVLAVAANERLSDLYLDARVPFLLGDDPAGPSSE